MRIAALSWRYLGHPAAGGAEIVTHEILRRLVDRGCEVTSFTATFPDALGEDELDGVRIVREGKQATVHLHAWRWLRGRLASFDRVVDQVNTIPFLTPLYVPREKRRLFIFQLAREYWWRETRGLARAISPLGYALEPAYLRLYRKTPAITGSNSTRQDLSALGLEDITVVPLAITTVPLTSLPPRSPQQPRVVMVGRLTPAKFVEEGLEAFAAIRRVHPDAELDVVGGGDGSYRRRLERWVEDNALGAVKFHGRVTEKRKQELLQRADVHLFASHREGWGLVVSEAAALGTPSVGYDVPGVRDSIGDSRLLAPCRDTAALAAAAVRLLRDPALYEEVRKTGWEHARLMSADATAEAFAGALGV